MGEKSDAEIERRRLFTDVARKEKEQTRGTRIKRFLSKKDSAKAAVSRVASAGFKPLTRKQASKARGARISQIARKAISLAAPKGGLVKSLTTDTKKKRGRGRPKETYKVRVLPSGKVVKVPTHIYKKMVSAENTQIRLVQAQKQQYAEQIAMGQDPRFQQGAEEQFLAEQDPAHELDVARAQAGEPIYVQESSQPFQQAQNKFSQFGRGISKLGGLGRRQEQAVDAYGRTIPSQYPQRTQARSILREPNVSIWNADANVLNAPNIFNKPRESNLALRRRRTS